MKIGIIGKGTVGTAVSDGLQQIGHDLLCHDIRDAHSSVEDVCLAEIVFVCVPTDSLEDGACDISQVVKVVQELDNQRYPGIVVIKSTVPPGTTQGLINRYPDLTLAFVPEFLRAKSALTDFVDQHDVLIVGCHDRAVYEKILACHAFIPHDSAWVTPGEAEMTKYFSNLYNAMRITFANGMFEMCQALDIDYQKVLFAVTKRSQIGQEYLRCSSAFRGFGGHCLPKDAAAFERLRQDLGLDHVTLFRAMIEDNAEHNRRQV